MPLVTMPAGWSRVLPSGHQPSPEKDAGFTFNGFTLKGSPLLYIGVALGVLAGAAISTYLWRRRLHALNLLQTSPLERAEQIISSCEDKLDALEQAMDDLKTTRPESS